MVQLGPYERHTRVELYLVSVAYMYGLVADRGYHRTCSSFFFFQTMSDDLTGTDHLHRYRMAQKLPKALAVDSDGRQNIRDTPDATRFTFHLT